MAIIRPKKMMNKNIKCDNIYINVKEAVKTEENRGKIRFFGSFF